MRVLVIHHDLILGMGIEGLLAREGDIRVKGVNPSKGSGLSAEIADFQPDIIIFDEVPNSSVLSTLFDLMAGYPDPRILVMNVHNNRILIYQRQELEITHSDDLLTVIRSQLDLSMNRKDLSKPTFPA
jgi:DNA-binding NarL/FixJ family response regulator